MKTHHIFISHSWAHSDDLQSLHYLLQKRGYFVYASYEVPKHAPINSQNGSYIKQKLRERIKNSNIMLALAGIYASHSEWMKWEIETAKELEIPIVGIIPRGQERVSQIVFSNSIVDVRWNTESIVNAIRTYSKK
ncbi:TIR domain-containing protein [Avibacterium avium]|uniref:TIR domain-containing protein n=1 Tax=Avibacterium avium TaxID=751 RepID=UPI003BF80AA1